MKKNFFKKLALVLALVLTVTSLNYAPASAAATPAWKATKSVISLQNRYAYGVKNVPSKGKVAWKIGNTKVAKISQKGSVLAVGAGTTTVKATVKNSKGTTVKTLTQKVTVKAPVWNITKDTLKEGERTSFTKQYTATGAKVKWASSNTEVARVSQKGSVLAVKAGKTTITATFSMGGEEYATLTKDVTVEITETAIQSVEQNTTTELTATFGGDTKDVKASDFSIVRNSDNVVIAIKSAAVSKENAQQVVIETYVDMKDGKEYTVTFKGTKDSSAKFLATDGTVADVNVTPITITAGKATKINVQTVDAKGIILGTYTINDASSNDIDFSISSTTGYMEDEKLNLPEIGNTATATVTYHTYKYDDTDQGKEIGAIKKEVTITAVKDASTVSNYQYTITKDAPNWNSTSFTANTKIAANEEKNVFFNIKDSAGDEIDDYYNYKVSSSDLSKVIVSETELSDNSTGIAIKGVEAGTAHILVKDKDGKTLTSLPVVVTAAKKLTTILLDRTSVTISTSDEAKEKQTIKVTPKDQFGNDLDISGYDFESTKTPKDATAPSLTINDKKIEIEGGAAGFAVAGTYVYKVSITVDSTTLTRNITVAAKEPNSNANPTYRLDIAGVDTSNVVDLKVANDTKAEDAGKTLTVKVAELKGGVVNSYVTASSITVKKSDGKEYTNVSGNEVTLSSVSGSAVTKEAATGTYNVEVKYTDYNGKERTLKKAYTVKDTQTVPTVVVKKTDGNNNSLSGIFADSDFVEVSYDGSKIDSPEVTFEKDDYVNATGSNSYFVKYARVNVKLDSGVTVVVKVAVNRPFNNVAGI